MQGLGSGYRRSCVLVMSNEDELDLYRDCFSSAGWDIRTAATATAALALLEEEVPHVVITELWLAGGMSGWALLRAIRSSAGSDDVVVIVITSFTSPEMMSDLFAADANGCILKPVFPDVLLRAASTARSGSVRDFFSIMPLQEPVSLGARLRAHP